MSEFKNNQLAIEAIICVCELKCHGGPQDRADRIQDDRISSECSCNVFYYCFTTHRVQLSNAA